MLTQAPNQPQRSEFARRGTKQERRQSASRQYETPHSCWKGWRVKQILLDSGVRRGCLACLGEFLVIAQRKNYNTVTSLTFSRSLAQPEPLVLHDYINTSLILTLDTLSSAFSPSNFLPQLSAVLSTRVQHVVAFLTRCRLNHLPKMTRSLPRSINLGRISHGNRRQPRKYTLMDVVNTKQTDQSSRLIASGSTMIDLASKEKKSIRVFHVHKALLCFYSIPRQIAQRILCRRHYPMSTTDRSRSQSRNPEALLHLALLRKRRPDSAQIGWLQHQLLLDDCHQILHLCELYQLRRIAALHHVVSANAFSQRM